MRHRLARQPRFVATGLHRRSLDTCSLDSDEMRNL